jgi:copper transport protein
MTCSDGRQHAPSGARDRRHDRVTGVSRHRTRGAVARGVTAAAISVGLVLGMPTVADAHATLVSAEPAGGSTLRSPPHRIRLVFNEPVEPSLGQITLIAAGGTTAALHASGDPHDVHALLAPVDSLGPGTYHVVWRVVSVDGHPVSGSLVFAIGIAAPDTARGTPVTSSTQSASERPAAVGPVVAGAPMLAAVLRGAGAWSLMTLSGLLFFLVWIGPAHAPRATRVVRWLAIAAPVLLGAHLVTWLADTAPEHHLDAAWAQAALATYTGRAELARCALALLALWAVWLARRMPLALLFTLGGLVVSSAIGHAAAIHPAWSLPVKVVHLVAASAWVGGLAWLVVGEGHESGLFLVDAKRVSTIALVSVIAVLVTGTIETLVFAPSPMTLLRSAYGALIVAKLVGLAALVAFGAYHRKYGLPQLRRGIGAIGFRRSVAWEFSVMAAVVLLGGWLAYVAPPTGGNQQSLAFHSPPLVLSK